MQRTSSKFTFVDVVKTNNSLLVVVKRVREDILKLCYEGKVTYAENLENLKRDLCSYERAFEIHQRIGEEVLYPFICKHVPKLYFSADFFIVEHQEIEMKYEQLRSMLEGLFLGKLKDFNSIIKQLRYGLDYFICLLEGHLKIEEGQFYRKAFEYFTQAEMTQLSEKINMKFDEINSGLKKGDD